MYEELLEKEIPEIERESSAELSTEELAGVIDRLMRQWRRMTE